MKTTTLRVGICSCSRCYRNQMQGLCFRVGGQNFRLKEVVIPEELQSRTIEQKRCHFFLDFHRDHDMQPPCLVDVVLENIQPPTNRDIQLEAEWEGNQPAPVSEVLTAMQTLLKGLRPRELKNWLKGLARPQRLSKLSLAMAGRAHPR